MPVNQREIADNLDISIATVSRALKGDCAISASTRAQVLEMASRLGYNPTVSTRFRRSGEPRPDDERPFCVLIQTDDEVIGAHTTVSRYLAGMSVAAEEFRRPLIVHYIRLCNREHAYEPDKLPAPLRDGRAVGAVLLHYYPAEVVRRMAEQFPCISVIYDYRVAGVDSVGMNEMEMVSRMTDRLIADGHRRIGFAGNLRRHSWACRRFAGRIASFSAAGIDLAPELQFELDAGDNAPELYDDIADAVHSGMTALVAANDEIGYAVIHQMHRRGIRVPEELSVTGFDGIEPPLGMPRLCSARMPAEDMGAAAIRALAERSSHPAMPVRQILLDCPWIPGETTGPHK